MRQSLEADSVSRDLLTGRAATIVISTCLAIVAGSVLALALPGWRRAAGLGAVERRGYAAGDRVDVPDTIHDSAPFTLLIFTRSSCSACERAKPIVAHLAAALRDRAAVRLMLIVEEGTEAIEREYLRDVGLAEDRLAALDFRTLRLRRIPTTLLVDRAGRVRQAHEGELSAIEAAELLRIAASVESGR
jgi:thiol-disulfide isomerase/thioredoxin